MEVRVTFGSGQDEALGPTELEEIQRLVPATSVRTEPGGLGVGAAATGITVVLELAERAMNDFGSFVGLGTALAALIKWRRSKSKQNIMIADEVALGSLGAASVPTSWRPELDGAEFRGCRPLLGRAPLGPNWVGTDSRDIWEAIFERPGELTCLYLSPTGMILGCARVPFETYFDGRSWITRSQAELDDLFYRWNASPSAK